MKFLQQAPWPAARRSGRLGWSAWRHGSLEPRRSAGRFAAPWLREAKGGGRSTGCRNGAAITLVGKADRIDRLPDGRIAIYDYKSGKPPTEKEERSFAKQLWLEAAMAADGAFGKTVRWRRRASPISALVRPRGLGRMTPRAIRSSAEIRVPRFWPITSTRHRLRPPRGQEHPLARDYDQLARYGEWDETSKIIRQRARSGITTHDRDDERRHACSGRRRPRRMSRPGFPRMPGSGKTRVLTDRVARLLLDEVPPERILCLTYTKAAAMEMQNRLFSRLGTGR
jgi:RecB family exonuclease